MREAFLLAYDLGLTGETSMEVEWTVYDRLSALRKTAVMIGTGAGHGSGFFISRDGDILTNAHVVGDADLVRVVTSNKSHVMTAEVLRVDKERDVAMLCVQEMPERFNPMILPIRREIPKVGEDVYAIGAPLSEKDLQDTVTMGIVSAWRPHERMSRQSFMQADVTIQPGNNGGLLIDGRGNVIGLSVAGYTDDAGAMTGLNLFIPIDEALRKLDIGE